MSRSKTCEHPSGCSMPAWNSNGKPRCIAHSRAASRKHRLELRVCKCGKPAINKVGIPLCLECRGGPMSIPRWQIINAERKAERAEARRLEVESHSVEIGRVLRDWPEGAPVDVVADALGITTEAVLQIEARAMAKLSDALKDPGWWLTARG